MFGCLGKILSALFFIILGAVLHAQWPAITRELRERNFTKIVSLAPEVI